MDGDSDSLRALPTRRVATRYVVRIAATLRCGDRAVEGTIVDISASGALVECEPLRVAPGTSVSIDLGGFVLEQRVCMLAKHVRDTAAGCALRFSDPDPFLRVFVKLVRLFEDSPRGPLAKRLADT